MSPTHTHGADSEVGRLRTVMLHRPGDELKRLTPRNNDKLLFDGIPWVARAQEEHDAFARLIQGIPSKSSLSLLRGVSRFSSSPGRWSITVRSRPTSLSAPWGRAGSWASVVEPFATMRAL